ncbi:hypothetical protein [Brachybacterium nesterenkovii]|uniref:Uncharacterized protein n=1 Tax=Brachybacterium nesterenkovii TaxID=47847 RepID=A0A1X6WSL5_9MICO|nr:hypothetical protein [Brachybacterium nesterenkovii]SLM87875.1 hypothetical protein FM110_00480 [Brachybacterium nesterenkovii]
MSIDDIDDNGSGGFDQAGDTLPETGGMTTAEDTATDRPHAEESSPESAGDDPETGDPEGAEPESGLEPAPGAAAPVGSGVEGADDLLEADREPSAQDAPVGAVGTLPGQAGQDDATAAEQGNRDEDRMVAADADELAEVDGLTAEHLDPGAIEQVVGDDEPGPV